MGQLHVEHFGLRDVAESGDSLLIGVIESVVPPADRKESHDSAIVLRVEKVVGPDPGGGLRAGANASIAVYGGVVWDDPHKSPLDRRLRGAIGPKRGDRVVAVPSRGFTCVELLPADERTLRIVSILWDPATKATWLASKDLEADLAIADLAPMAVAELDKRGALTAARLLAADDQFRFEFVRDMAPERKLRFLTEAAPLAKADPVAFRKVFQLATYEPRPEWIGAAAPLIAGVDPTAKESERLYSDLHLALVIVAGGVEENRFPGPLDLSPFADFLVQYEKHRPRWKSSDDDLPKLTAHMDARAKAAMAVGFVRSAHTSSFADGDYDNFLLYEAVRLAKEAPDASLIAAMATIDPTMPNVGSERRFAMGALLEMGTAIVAGLPGERARVQEVVQPWIDQQVDAPVEALAEYGEVVGEPVKSAPQAATLELSAGQSKRLPDGLSIRYTKRDDGWMEISFDRGREGQSNGLDPELDGYREYWIEPYVVTIDRIGSPERVRVSLTPHASKPADLEDPEGCRIAEAIAEKAGCPDREFYEHRRWEGVLEYRATGPGGKTCVIFIGTWTQAVARVVKS